MRQLGKVRYEDGRDVFAGQPAIDDLPVVELLRGCGQISGVISCRSNSKSPM
jgi:hypothetical protein